MTPVKLKTYLEVITNIAVLLVALVVMTTFAMSFFSSSPEPQLQVGLEVGEQVTGVPSVTYSDSPQTLLIVLDTNCAYCQESVPFYKRLVEAHRQKNSMTRVLGVFSDKADVTSRYIKAHQLNLDAVASVDISSLKVGATPTIMLVNSTGSLVNFWEGKLSPDVEQQVINAL